MCNTYSITYQYKPEEWHSHYRVSAETADMLIRTLADLGRNYRVRQNATGKVLEVKVEEGKEHPTLLHLFSNRISDRNGKATVE